MIAGSGLDVSFTLISPSGYNLASDFRQSDGIHVWVTKTNTFNVKFIPCNVQYSVQYLLLLCKYLLISVLFSCRVDSTDEGDYQVCFENKFSKISEKLVFFKVIVSADQGQYAWDEWLEEAIPENLLDYKLQDIRVRSENSSTYLEHLPTSGETSHTLMLLSVLFLSPSVGEHGLGVLESGAESSGPVCTAGF